MHNPLSFLASIKGVAAAEFGLLTPVFALCLIAMLDVGLAINERMYLDRVLRSGAQLVMNGTDDIAELESAVLNASESEDDSPPTLDTVDYNLNINRSCECDGAAGACNDRCASGKPPSLFYDFSASQLMNTLLLPAFSVESNVRVQVR